VGSTGLRRVLTAVLTAAMVLAQVTSSLWPMLAPGAVADAAHAEPARISGVSPIVSSTFTVGAGPRGVTIDPATNRAFVSNWGAVNGTTVTVLQLGAIPAATTTVATITVGTAPRRSAVSTDTNEVYVPNQVSGTVSVINISTNAVVATVPVGSGPVEAAYHAAERSMYIANNAGGGTVVTKINVDTRSTSSFTVPGFSLSGIAVNNVTGRVYAIANAANALYVIQANTVVATVDLGTGANPSGVAVNEQTDQIWVSVAGGVTVVNGDTNTTAYTISTAAHEGLALNAGANRTYVPGGSGGFSVLNGAPRTTTPLPAGSQPTEAAVAPNGFVVVTNSLGNSVTVVQEDADAFVPKIVVSDGKDSLGTTNNGVVVLREAFQYADGSLTPGAKDRRLMSGGTPGAGTADRIHFDLAAFPVPAGGADPTTVTLGSELPALGGGDSVIGEGRVLLSGSVVPTSPPSAGIRIGAGGATVLGTYIRSFGTGIEVGGTGAVQIGDGTVAGRNALSGNVSYGVRILSNSATTIRGNYIGTSVDGLTALGNGSVGIDVNSASGGNDQ